MKLHGRLAPLCLAFAVGLVLVSCGSDDPVTVSGNTAQGGSAPNASSSPEWLNIGTQIVEGREKALLDRTQGKAMYPNAHISQFGPYLTQPVTVDRSGVQTLLAGPLRASEDADQLSSVSLPPDLTKFFEGDVNMLNRRVETVGNQRFVALELQVSSLRTPYVGFRVWVH